MKDSEVALDVQAIEAYLREVFPQLYHDSDVWTVESVGPMTARMRVAVNERHLRPGGTISGPTMFALADLALYVAVLAQIGPRELAVTTNLNINFLRKPDMRDLVGDCRLLKLGQRLAVGEVWITSDGKGDPVAHATGTYSIPPH